MDQTHNTNYNNNSESAKEQVPNTQAHKGWWFLRINVLLF